MKKLFVQYPNFRTSTGKFDPCIMGASKCDKCKVFVISDRFLGEDMMKKLDLKRKFPYVIIADTAGCMLRCWFCYAHPFWTKERAEKLRCYPLFLSPEEIAEQFKCKIAKIYEMKDIMDDKPFMRLRISGGEPIFATRDILDPYKSEKEIDYKLGIDFWIEFFEKIDHVIRELKHQKKLNVVNKDKWQKGLPWPTFIADSENRVNIRFDTAGIPFSENEEGKRITGGNEIAEHFIGKIYNLHKSGKLDNVKIWITYSFKGATPNEYYWSQRRMLPATKEKNNPEYIIEEHPQYSGYKNLQNEIDRYCKANNTFRKCIEITVEKGIHHDLEHKIYMYNPEAFDWRILSEKAKIQLSEVKNDICIIYTYGGGPWSLYKQTPGLIKRYLNQNAEFILESDKDRFVCTHNTMDEARKATHFIGIHHSEKNHKVIVRPTEKIELLPIKTVMKQPKSQRFLHNYDSRESFEKGPNAFIITASSNVADSHFKKTIIGSVKISDMEKFLDKDTMEKVIKIYGKNEIKLWGSVPKAKNLKNWNTMKEGDYILTYQRGKFNYICRVALKIHNKELSETLWGTDEDGRTWEYIYFLKDFKPVSFELDDFKQITDYPNEWFPFGFTLIRKDAIEADSVEEFIKTLEKRFAF